MRITSKTLMKAYLSVIAFVIFGSTTRLRGDAAPAHLVQQAEDGSINLGAADAKIKGPNARLEGGDVKDIIWWTSADTSISWMAHVNKPGNYRVEVAYTIIGSNNGSPLAITVGDQMVEATPNAGTGVNDYKTGQAGEVTIRKPGDLQVVIKPRFTSHEFVIAIRSIILLPAGTSAPAIDISGGAIKQADDGSFKLTAADAEIDGMNAQLEQPEGVAEKDIGHWNDMDTSA